MKLPKQRIFTDLEKDKHADLLEAADRTGDSEEQQALEAYEKVLLPRLIALLERLMPPSKLEMLAKPMFLSDDALFDPSLALDLVVREERRLLDRLPVMLDRVRADGDAKGADSETLKTAGS